jgi:hypothetical protein
MAEIKFYANVKADDSNTLIAHTLGSGLGFYGSSFGISVPVGSQQRTTYVTNADGTDPNGIELHNTAMVDSGVFTSKGTVSVNGGTAVNLDLLPNYKCPLNIRFTHSTPVRVQNCKLRIFDRNDISKPASGVTTWVYEARRPSPSNDINIGSLNFRANKDTTTSAGFRWTEFDPTIATPQLDMPLTSSPGMSGLNTDTGDNLLSLGYATRDGISHQSMRHDWYVALSSQPDSIGSKTNYGLYFTVEYL